VAVSLVVRLLSKKKQLLVRLFTDFASLFLFGILAWRSMVYADNLREYGEVTMTMQLPYHPFVYILAASSLAVALLYLIDILKTMKKVVSL
jgi:TRAP-type C4-dicarboxylate transport system permease small subunit